MTPKTYRKQPKTAKKQHKTAKTQHKTAKTIQKQPNTSSKTAKNIIQQQKQRQKQQNTDTERKTPLGVYRKLCQKHEKTHGSEAYIGSCVKNTRKHMVQRPKTREKTSCLMEEVSNTREKSYFSTFRSRGHIHPRAPQSTPKHP